jgi:anaerobic selenocysteine-containing dehydrogenase
MLEQADALAPDTLTLKLVSRRRRLGHNSWLHRAAHDGEAEQAAWLSPADMAQLGLSDGGQIIIQSGEQAVTLQALPKPEIQDGVLVVPHGLPKQNINKLIPSGAGFVEPISGNHWMTGVAVSVVPALQVAATD